jgi:hypothetical protein
MLLICVLFGLAYVTLVALVCITLKRSRLLIEQAYPLTEPPKPYSPPRTLP